MAEIINLNRVRKARARDEARASAEVNRARYGRNRAEREAADKARDTAERHLDGHRREPDDD